MTITKHKVDLHQGLDHRDHPFGYVAGDGGGFFFTWMTTLEETLNSIEEDQDGDGGLGISAVREFLAEFLPTTGTGRSLWGYDA